MDKKYYLLYLVIGLLWIGMIQANPVQQPHVKATLIAEMASVSPGESFWVSVHLQMDPHWHTYWKYPGEAGLATEINWNLPKGVSAGPIIWPYPKRFYEGDIITQGYEDEVFFLTKITIKNTGKEKPILFLQARVNWLVCKEICLPGEALLSLEIPITPANTKKNSYWGTLSNRIDPTIPFYPNDWGFQAILHQRNITLRAVPPQGHSWNPIKGLFFPVNELPLDLRDIPTWQKTDLGYELNLQLTQSHTDNSVSLHGILYNDTGWLSSDNQKAIELNIPFTSPVDHTKEVPSLIKIISSMIFAFLGGIILNLMPCVFPVLSLKILGFIQQGEKSSQHPLVHAGLFTVGVLASFLVFAGILLVARETGEQIGWGFQLQSPNVITFLALLFFLLALNLFGLFEIGLWLTRIGGCSSPKGWLEPLFSGALVTVAATPCTAPFMGAALGFALAQDAIICIAIFVSLGLGVSFPYLLLTSFQGLIRFVPKPGQWMETMKQGMGFLLIGTVIWLIFVLEALGSGSMVIPLLSGFLVISIGGWAYGKWKKNTLLVIGEIAVIGFGISLPFLDFTKEIHWETFSPEKIKQFQEEGNMVFIDFTAVWCLSCLANERVVLSSKKVQRAFKKMDVVLMKADWTKKNPEITQELRKHGRSSVPLYLLYSKDVNRPPIILPEILTSGIVLEALERENKYPN